VAAAAAPAAASAGAGITSAAAPAAGAATLTPEEKFGLSGEGLRKVEGRQGVKGAKDTSLKDTSLKELDAHIAGVSRNSAGRAVFTLDNGQVWRQSETRSSFEAHAGDAVRITPGVLGSYWLSTDTHNGTRVERLP
jgi:hypothetical protein